MFLLASTIVLSTTIACIMFGTRTLDHSIGWITTVFFRLLLLIGIKIMILFNLPKGIILECMEENWKRFLLPLSSNIPFGRLSVMSKILCIIDLNQLQIRSINFGSLRKFQFTDVEIDFSIHIFLGSDLNASTSQTIDPTVPTKVVLNTRIRLNEISITFNSLCRLFPIFKDFRVKNQKQKERNMIWHSLLSVIIPKIELSGINVIAKFQSLEDNDIVKDQNSISSSATIQQYLHAKIDIKKFEFDIFDRFYLVDDKSYTYNKFNSSIQELFITTLLFDNYYAFENVDFSKEFWESNDVHTQHDYETPELTTHPSYSVSTFNSHKRHYYQLMLQVKNITLSTSVPNIKNKETELKFNMTLDTTMSSMTFSSCDNKEMKNLLNNQAVISAKSKVNLFVLFDTVSCEMNTLSLQNKDITIQIDSFSLLEFQQLNNSNLCLSNIMMEICKQVKIMKNASGLYNEEHFYVIDRNIFVTIISQCNQFQVMINLSAIPSTVNNEDTLMKKILVKINSPMQIHWNILLQVLAFSMFHGFSKSLKFMFVKYGAFVAKKSTTKKKKMEEVHVSIQSNNQILINAVVGIDSGKSLDIILQDIAVRVEKDNFDSLKKKPNLVAVKSSQVQVYVEDFYAPLGTINSIQFTSTYGLADKHEIDQYYSYKYDKSDINSLELCKNKLKSNMNDLPFIECSHIESKDIIIRIPPDPPFGELIDSITKTVPAVNKTIRKIRQTSKSPAGFQLMKISAKVAHIDASIMEYLMPSNSFCRENKENRHTLREDFLNTIESGNGGLEDTYFHYMRVLIRNIDLNIKRNSPPSYVQQRLQELDEHPGSKQYGADIHGGEEFLLTIKHVIVMIAPLNLIVPLAEISDIQYKGLLFIAPLMSSKANKSKKEINFPCFHSKQGNKDTSYGCCDYCINIISDDIPPKVYLDGSFFFRSARIIFGKEVQLSMPKLMILFKRLQPPPSSKKSIALGWWDNLRFLIHGRFQVDISKFQFEWLLDRVEQYNRSIQLTCTRMHLQHSVGSFKLDMSNIVLSIPNQTYSSTIFSSEAVVQDSDMHKRMKSYRDLRYSLNSTQEEVKVKEEEGEELNDRYSLLFFPKLKMDCSLEWSVSNAHVTASSEHHNPYLNDHPVVYEQKKNLDFTCFRSNGVHLQIQTHLVGHADYSNWLILRNDNMPWFTHQPSFDIPTRESKEDDPGPIPKILSLNFKGSASDLRVGLWRNNPLLDKNGLCVILPSVSVKSSSSVESNLSLFSSQSNDLGMSSSSEALVSSSTVIELGSAYAAMLDVTGPRRKNEIDNSANDYSYFFRESMIAGKDEINSDVLESDNNVQDMDNFFKSDLLGDDKGVDWCDRMAGLFGAREDEIVDALDSSSNLSDVAYSNIDSAPPYGEDDANNTYSEFDDVFAQSSNENPTDYFDRMAGMLGATDDAIHRKLLEFTNDLKGSIKRDGKIDERNAEDGHLNVFKVIQLAEISDLDYLVEINKVLIIDRSQDDMLSTTFDIGSDNKGNSSNTAVPWTLIVSNMKLLWTLEIRNVILLLIDDLLETINFMTLQLKENNSQFPHNEENITIDKIYVPNYEMNSNVTPTTKLEYLLNNQQSAIVSHATTDQPLINSSSITDINNKGEIEQSLPTFNVHLSNPQIQLHSKATGGGIIFAVRGAYIEGRKGKNLIQNSVEFDNYDLSCASIDDFLRRLDFECTLEKVEAYGVSTNVDVGAGLQWLGIDEDKNDRKYDWSKWDDDDDNNLEYSSYLQSLLTTKQFIPPLLSRKILDHCTFRTKLIFYKPPVELSNDELMHMIAKDRFVKCNSMINKLVNDQTELQVDELSFMLDSHQFGTTIDLIRNLFLAPLPSSNGIKLNQDDVNLDDKFSGDATSDTSVNDGDVSSSTNEKSASSSCLSDKTMLVESLLQGNGATINKRGRKNLKEAISELMSSLEKDHVISGSRVIRNIKWRLGKAKWSIRSEKFFDDVVIDLTELCGQHEFSVDGTLTSTIDLENLYISSFKPDPLYMLFDDPTSVLGTSLGVSESPCRRCGIEFIRTENRSDSCRFHADRFGNPGTYDALQNKWTCCGAGQQGTGCVARPHTGKERVISIRVENFAPTIENLTIYKHVEVNIYPGVPYKLIVQLTKNMADLFMDYFMGEKDPHPTATDNTASLNDTNQPPDTAVSSEIFFVKYWKFGNIIVDVSALGFPIIPVTTGLIIQVPAFCKHYKIGTANYLGSKYLSHLIQEVIKSATSSGIGMLRDRFIRQQPEHANTEVEIPATEELAGADESESDEATTNDSPNVSNEGKLFARKTNLLLGTGKLRKKMFGVHRKNSS